MNILLISQCDKRALVESRRLLDQFAERRGDRTWQTPITQAGLDTLRRLLRKTARKNTAVACHWIRGLDHSELLWIVGDASRFNAQGTVPTNTTTRNVLRGERENDWHTGEDIRLLAQLAALLHDLGKASVAFQARLRGKLTERNLYRHEWVSLRLFAAFVGEDDDAAWLARLADSEHHREQDWIAAPRYQRDGIDAAQKYPFRSLPPLAAAVAWLVVTHHRLPLVPVEGKGGQRPLGCRSERSNPLYLETPLDLVAHDWNEVRVQAERERIEAYWTPAGALPVVEAKWRAQAARIARRLQQRRAAADCRWLDDPYVMHLARLCLMLADHHYSGLPKNSPQRVSGGGTTKLFANTDSGGGLKQPLDEHLLGVARDAGQIAHALPGFEQYLPRLVNHRGLRKRSADPRFAWQDKAFDAAAALRSSAREHGAFVINMASTGCGKTLANARVLYALADPQRGMRATYALGLRTLTLQTGRSYRNDLHLTDDDLAIRVGGSASRALFEYYEEQAETRGSASVQSLIEEDSHVRYEGTTADHPLLSVALADPEIRKLLSAPLLVCTVDHLAPATESTRAGRQIAPMLRLLSADLVLDELDDYDLDDLPALTRLVHWAGLLGTRVVLSSATLPPALVEGMFLAYCAGRRHYRRNRGADGGNTAAAPQIPCLWADEFGVHDAVCADAASYAAQHAHFVERRAARLAEANAAPLRRGELIPLQLTGRESEHAAQFARQAAEASLRLHAHHAETCPRSGKRVSFGIVRMANIAPLFDVARAWFALDAPDDVRVHLCVYHARFPLLQRSAIEHQLDAAFQRRGDAAAVYALPSVRDRLEAYPERDHLFVVLASPVCEVGRDWDADWAVAEPSSLRALIQLAGRVQRHRGKRSEHPNVLIFDTNLRHFRRAGDRDKPAFIYPGFEKAGVLGGNRFRLEDHRLGKLVDKNDYAAISALPRIRPRPMAEWQSRRRLVDLEQARIAACMLPREQLPASLAAAPREPLQRDESSAAWRYPQAALTGVLQQQQPFRDDSAPTTALVLVPDDDEECLLLHRVESDPRQRSKSLYTPIGNLRHDVGLPLGARMGYWGGFDLMTLLAEQADYLERPLRDCAQRLATVTVPGSEQGWRYHPWLGFTKV
ncbi:MAG: type I-F CRISPR-associated helicase Cas3 [Rhodanobacteraceae bacterium]|nr:type I-F CRISPR-associated helicase Cas3 [Rhodanobacteraceae bacterium]